MRKEGYCWPNEVWQRVSGSSNYKVQIENVVKYVTVFWSCTGVRPLEAVSEVLVNSQWPDTFLFPQRLERWPNATAFRIWGTERLKEYWGRTKSPSLQNGTETTAQQKATDFVIPHKAENLDPLYEKQLLISHYDLSA